MLYPKMSCKIKWWQLDLNWGLSQTFSRNRGHCKKEDNTTIIITEPLIKGDNTTIIITEPLIKGDKRFMLKKYGNTLVSLWLNIRKKG